MLYVPFLASALRRLMDLMGCLLLSFKTVAPCCHPAWSNPFVSARQHLHSCWNYTLIQPVPKKGDRSSPRSYRPMALFASHLKFFNQSLINWKIQKHLSTSNILSDRQYGFRKGRSTGDLLTISSDSWSSSLSRFSETFSVALDILKAFDRVKTCARLYRKLSICPAQLKKFHRNG